MGRYNHLAVEKLTAKTIARPPVDTAKWGFAAAGALSLTNNSATDTAYHGANLTPGNHPTFGSPVVNAATVKYLLKFAPATGGGGALLTNSAAAVTADITNFAVMDQGMMDTQYDVFAAGTASGTSGTSIAVTIPGLRTTDLAFVTKRVAGTAASVLNSAVCTANTLTLTLASAMNTTNTFSYMILRRAGDFTPSHFIAYAGYTAFDPDAASGTVTVTGASANDVLILTTNVTGATNLLLYAAPTADTITATYAGDPGTAGFSYVLLRP